MDHFIRSWFCRGVVWVLIPALVLTSVPAQAWDKPDPGVPVKKTPPPPPKVKVNRTPPKVKPVPLFPVFSETPTDKEVFRARVFAEPLVPLGSTTAEENRALAEAITAYLGRKKSDDLTAIEDFLRDHPASAWRASLLMNTGLLWRRLAYFTRAQKALLEAWELARDATDAHGKATAERALRQLLELHMAFGAVEPVEDLLEQVEGRTILGPTADMVREAKGHVQVLREKHELAVPSGPIALQSVLHRLRPGEPPNKTLAAFPADHDGATLAEMHTLAKKAGMKLQMAFRPAGLDVSPDGTPLSLTIPTPSVIHLKVGHFAALVEVRNDRVRLDDPFLGGETWMTRQALEEEASGYFLVPEETLPSGWRQAQAREVETVRGKCASTSPDGELTGQAQQQKGGNQTPCPPWLRTAMATYSFLTLLVSLRITDSPVGYSPPRGPTVYFQVSYNQREATQPSIFYFSNLGSRWTFDWQSWVEDDPADPFQPVKVVARGGGAETSTGSDGVTYQPSLYSRAVVVRTQTSPIRYERRFPDGSVDVFAQPDGAMTSPRRVFLTEVKDPQGNALTFTYDQDLRLISVTDTIGQVTTLSYDMAGDPWKITRVTDPFGREAKLEYDGEGRLVRITDVIGIVSEMAYSGDFVSELTTPYGTTRFATGSFHYSNNKDLWLQATDPLGGTERLEYLYIGPTGLTDPDPPQTVPVGFANQNNGFGGLNFFYWDKRAQALHPGDYTKARHYRFLLAKALTISGMLQSEKAPLENRVWYFQDGEWWTNSVGTYGRPTRIGQVLDDGQSQVYRYEYGPLGNVTRYTDPVGRETVYEYDFNGIDLVRVKQKNGSSYDLLWSASYDTQHSPSTITDAAGQTWTQTYSSQGQLLTVTTPPRAGITENRTTTYMYDTDGYLQSLTKPATGATTSYTYDSYGRVRTITDDDGYTVTLDYDVLDRPIRVTFPDNTYEETVYNRLDPERHRDRMGRWSHVFHDALRRVVSIRDAAGRSTSQEWCTCGSLDKLTDANGNATVWERDIQSRATREVRANGSAKEFVYETATSRLRIETDAKNQEIHYQYFLDDRLQQISYVNAQFATPSVSYTYDAAYDRVQTMSDGSGTTTFGYHPIGVPPLLGASGLATVDGPLANDTVSYGYDELGRVVTAGPPGTTTTYSYDALGRIMAQTNALGTFTYAYSGTGSRLQSITYPNGQTTTYSYYPNAQDKRLEEIHHRVSPGAATLSKFNYTYDSEGNITTWTQQYEANAPGAYDFQYDSVGQLTAAFYRTTDPTPTILKRHIYAYDLAGNRIGEQTDDAPLSVVHDNMNRLVSRQPGGPLRFLGMTSEPSTVTVAGQPAQTTAAYEFEGRAQTPSGQSAVQVAATDPAGNTRTNVYQVTTTGATAGYSYDAAGNLLSDATRTYEWDGANRLVAVTSGSRRSEFTYDGRGLRVRTRELDGSTVLADRRLIWWDYVLGEERDEGSGAVVRRYFPLGVQLQGTTYFYATDHIGSVRQVLDTAGTPRATYEYDPFGRRTKLAGDLDVELGFTGHYTHIPTGLLLAPLREYDSDAGRWLREDPIGLAGGLNLYGYVANDPINLVDPLGLVFKPKEWLRAVLTSIGILFTGERPDEALRRAKAGYAQHEEAKDAGKQNTRPPKTKTPKTQTPHSRPTRPTPTQTTPLPRNQPPRGSRSWRLPRGPARGISGGAGVSTWFICVVNPDACDLLYCLVNPDDPACCEEDNPWRI